MAAKATNSPSFQISDFSVLLENCFDEDVKNIGRLGLALSGGPDSMALCWLLSRYAVKYGGPEIHALHVDHGLRPESRQEAAQVAANLSGFEHVQYHILHWRGAKPQARIQEEARAARYELMAQYCKDHDIAYLLLGHHEDDQAETFLFRLAKGSGLDGLSAMSAVYPYNDRLTLVRPLLEVPKSQLVALCKEIGVDYINDSSNQNENFARVRLRDARSVLEKEGLSSKRLSVTAKRLSRARLALDTLAEKLYQDAVIRKDTSCIVLDCRKWQREPEELALRVLLKAMADIVKDKEYGPRLERVEDAFEDLRLKTAFRKRTLGGVVLERDDKAAQIILRRERG